MINQSKKSKIIFYIVFILSISGILWTLNEERKSKKYSVYNDFNIVQIDNNIAQLDMYFYKKLLSEFPAFYNQFAIALFIYNDMKDIIAGAIIQNRFGDIYISQLWVDPKYRNIGLGSKLLYKVEDLAREKECNAIFLQTNTIMDAVNFYQKMNYEIQFEISYKNGTKVFFMKKEL